MFDPQSNDFEGILLNSDPVYVSAAIQKAQIIVDETGTEAAAATGKIIFMFSIGNQNNKI